MASKDMGSGKRSFANIGAAAAILLLPFAALALTATLMWRRAGLNLGLLDAIAADCLQGFLRSATTGFIVAGFVVFLGYALVSLATGPIIYATRSTWRSRWTLLVIPAASTPLFIGIASFAFLYKQTSAIWISIALPVFSGPATAVLADSTAQVLRYAPLCVWLLLLSTFAVSRTSRLYAAETGISARGLNQIEFFGRWLAPALVLAAFAFQDAANDRAITELAIRPSPAIQTELLSHALERNFLQSLSLQPPPQVISTVISISGAAAVAFGIVFGMLATLLYVVTRMLSWPSMSRHTPVIDARPRKFALIPIFAVGVLALFGKLLLALFPLNIGILPDLEVGAATALAASLIATTLALALGYRIRESTRIRDRTATRSLALLAIIALAVGFIPPTGLAVAMFGLAYSTGVAGEGWSAGWLVLADVLRFTPIAFVFLIPTFLSVKDEELDYLSSIGAQFQGRVFSYFMEPNIVVIAAIFVVCFNQIMNEDAISSIFSAQVPSLENILERATNGRGGNYEIATAAIFLELSIFGLLLLGWGGGSISKWRGRYEIR